MVIDKLGIEFVYKWHVGIDELIWVWPWKRNGLPKYISILASGTGEFGDARFNSLKEIREFWHGYYLSSVVNSYSRIEPLTA